MTVDWDGQIRMDPSSPYAMARMVDLKDRFDVAFAERRRRRPPRHREPQRRPPRAEPLPRGRDRLPLRASSRVAGVRRRRQDGGQQQHDRPGGRAARPAARRGAGRLQVVRRRARSTGRSASAARRARARRSSAATAPSGRRTRTASSRTCSPPRSRRGPGRDPGEHYRALTAEFGAPCYTRVDAPATPEQKAKLAKLSPEAVTATDARRRADRREADQRARQRRADRRPQGDDGERLVRGAAVGHREHLQDLRGELPRCGAPARRSCGRPRRS